MLIDIPSYYRKLANSEAIGEDEVVALLKELDHFRHGAAHLASCAGATLEGLPKSTSKSERRRHQDIAVTAAKILDGDITSIRFPTSPMVARARCLNALERCGSVEKTQKA